MDLSIVATLYKSAAYIEEFHRRASAVARELAGDDYEVILVNDGSPDNSLDLAVRLSETDEHVTVVDLSRNFGHHKAMMAGLGQTTGAKVFLVDSDLEEEPEWLLEFSKQMSTDGCDVVFGVQKKRKGDWFERLTGWLFYIIVNAVTGFSFPRNSVTARLMTRRYLDALMLHQEREISIGGLFIITGFDQRPQPINKHGTNPTTYTLRHKMAVMVDSITSFSNKPLVSIFYVGGLILAFSSLYIVYLILNRLVYSSLISGWTSVMASIWFLGGLIISFIGLVGIYLSKIFTETKHRPNSIIRKVYGGHKS
jgi:putative glycosyltransferase